MSFEINCSNCGAPSSVSVGICPYCKKNFKNKKRKKDESPLISRIKADYKAGKVDDVISACKQMYTNKEKMRENNNFLLIYLKALLEMKRILKPNGKILLSIWSKDQPVKTRRKFDNYGTQMVPWKSKEKTIYRYYYIFKIDEINELFEKAQLKVVSHLWECGNEVFILENRKEYVDDIIRVE